MELKKIKHKDANRASANFTIIFNINLKMALKNSGILITKIVYIFTMILILALETFIAIKSQDVDSLGTYKVTFYVVSTILTLFYAMIITTYLLKKQWADGIHSIESRAGFKPWKSYLIRALVQVTIMTISNGIILLFVVLFNFISGVNTEIFFAYAYSQIFFLLFLSLIVTLMLLVIFGICNTLVGTMVSTVLMFFMAFSPLFASLKFMLTKNTIDYGLKLNAVDNFTRAVLNDNNAKVKDLFSDSLIDNKNSKYVVQFNENLENSKDLIEEETYDVQYMGLNQIPADFLNFPERINSEDEGFAILIWKNMISKIFNTGQFGYEWNYVTSSNADHELLPERGKNIFTQLPIYDILNDLLEITLENQYKFNQNSMGKTPAVFVNPQYYWNYESDIIQINDFIDQLKKLAPEYSSFLTMINKIYNKLSVVLNTDSSQIFSYTNRIVVNSYADPDLIFTSDITYNNYGSNLATYDLCGGRTNDWDITCNVTEEDKAIIAKNKEIENLYKSFPELAIINYLITNLWFSSFGLDSQIDNLYSYYNNSKTSKKLTTDVYRHFGVMSTGIFANSLINDTFNSSGYMPIQQGNTTSVKNILDYEKYTEDNLQPYALQEPYIVKEKLKYTNSFIIPLAYFVYMMIALPLGYIGYWFYERKTKI